MEIKQLELVFKLVKKYQIDYLKLPDGTEIHKALHTAPQTRISKSKSTPTSNETNYQFPESDVAEDLLFASSSAPAISLNTLNTFTSTENL